MLGAVGGTTPVKNTTDEVIMSEIISLRGLILAEQLEQYHPEYDRCLMHLDRVFIDLNAKIANRKHREKHPEDYELYKMQDGRMTWTRKD